MSEHETSHAPYLRVFLILLVLTLLEYFYAMFATKWEFPFLLLVLGLVVMALTKAALVGAYFMHVRYEGRWVYLLIVPACVMAAIVVLGLVPDIGMHRNMTKGPAPASKATSALAPPSQSRHS